jgi:YHS domain-containing protein
MISQKKTNRILIGFSFLLLLLVGFGSIAGGKSSAQEVAIKGYDTVAYFNAGNAVKGSEAFTFQWHGMTWYFSAKENRDLFAKGPEKYAPQYDGYCAWAMSEGRKSITDPEIWKIVDGKLYLQCSRSAFEKWSKDIPGHIKKADANWLKMYNKN